VLFFLMPVGGPARLLRRFVGLFFFLFLVGGAFLFFVGFSTFAFF